MKNKDSKVWKHLDAVRLGTMCATGVLLFAAVGMAQDAFVQLTDRANKEFLAKDFVAAEKDYRELLTMDARNVHANLYLGHSLYRQKKYLDAVGPYEKAQSLGQSKMTLRDSRILTDQIVMSYGIGGQLKKALVVLDSAIKRDPEYALNYYNRACALAEDGNKAGMLMALRQAFDRKQNILEGEKMPDPRRDSSFKKFTADPDFVALMGQVYR